MSIIQQIFDCFSFDSQRDDAQYLRLSDFGKLCQEYKILDSSLCLAEAELIFRKHCDGSNVTFDQFDTIMHEIAAKKFPSRDSEAAYIDLMNELKNHNVAAAKTSSEDDTNSTHQAQDSEIYDAIIVGGSFAGMAAALQLLQARRKVLIIDCGLRRNRFSQAARGFLGFDGVDPAKIVSTAREQVCAYPTLTWKNDEVDKVEGAINEFVAQTASGAQYKGRRLLFATGVRDTVPDIPGLAERWGTNVFHCPYCHGYEFYQKSLAVLVTSPIGLHQSLVVSDWGPVTLLTQGFEINEEMNAKLMKRNIKVENTAIQRIEGKADVHLADGRCLPFDAIFVLTRCDPSTPIAEKIGCELETTPLGQQIKVAANKETTIPGIFACGDVAKLPHTVSLAVGDGAWAGAGLHQSLIME